MSATHPPRRVLIPRSQLESMIGNRVRVKGWKLRKTFELVSVMGETATLRNAGGELNVAARRIEYVRRHLPKEQHERH